MGARLARTIDELPAADGVGVDMPIGLLAEGLRQPDRLARREVGPRSLSVFLTPPRPVLELESHSEASALARRLAGARLSRQAHGLRRKIPEVDQWLEKTKLAAGVELPRQVRGAPPDDLLAAGHAQVDDVLDAAVVAWSCRRLLRGDDLLAAGHARDRSQGTPDRHLGLEAVGAT